MASQVLHYVKCPKCESDKMAVAKKVVGKNRVSMLFGHCKDCGKMLQGTGHQEYLKAALSGVPESAPVAAPVQVAKEVKGAEDFDPVKHVEGEFLEAEESGSDDTPGPKKGGLLRLLGIVAFLAVGAVGGVAVANKLAGEG